MLAVFDPVSQPNCVVPKNIHTHPSDGLWKFLGEGGANKNLLWGEGSMDYGYFLELHVVNLNTFLDPVD